MSSEVETETDNDTMDIESSTKPRACRRRSTANPSPSTKRTRTYVEHNYQDHFNDPIYRPGEIDEEDVEAPKRRGPRGGVVVPFPERLYTMLGQVEEDGFEEIVSWQPHGRCFIVHQPKRFVEDVMPKYFRQSKLTSFQRQVNLYGFRRLTAGKDRGAYYHELFLRGRPDLHKKLVRIRVKGTGFKSASSPATEPNFYTYPRCIDGGASIIKSRSQDNAECEAEMPAIEPVAEHVPSASPSAPMLDIPMNPSWKPLSAPPKMMVVTPQFKPVEPPTHSGYEEFQPADSFKKESVEHWSLNGTMSLSSMARDIATQPSSAHEDEPCPITPESSMRQLVANGLEQALAMVSPADSPAPSAFSSMVSMADVPYAAPVPDAVESRKDTFQDSIQALLASDFGEFNVDHNMAFTSDSTADYALDPLFLLDDVVGPAH